MPYEQSRYNTYAITRGPYGSDGGLALDRNALLPLTAPANDFALHPSCVNLQQMANGTGNFFRQTPARVRLECRHAHPAHHQGAVQ
ncbi:MAG: hypothetical protein WDN00_11855 [Limisphaerales bacterium]